MKKFITLSICAFAVLACCQTQAVIVLPPSGGFKTAQERDNFNFYQQYNYQNEQQELLKKQVQIQQEMLNIQREKSWRI